MTPASEGDPQEPSPAGPDPDEQSPAGPAAAGDPPPPPVAEASSGAVPPTASPAGDAQQVETDLDALLANTQRERDEYLELAKRTKADFENYRKRMAAETQAAYGRGKAEASLAVINAVDNLERALVAAGVDPDREDPADGDGEDTGLVHGVLLVLRGLRETLGQMGIEAVDPTGEKFDPRLHEALSTQPGDGAEPGSVVEVIQKGYLVGEQLVRPARVVVAE